MKFQILFGFDELLGRERERDCVGMCSEKKWPNQIRTSIHVCLSTTYIM